MVAAAEAGERVSAILAGGERVVGNHRDGEIVGSWSIVRSLLLLRWSRGVVMTGWGWGGGLKLGGVGGSVAAVAGGWRRLLV